RRSGRLFVVTLGPAGSLALGGAQRLACPAAPVERVVDTTGAGDAYTAGFLCHYVQTGDVAASMERASAVAAATLGHVGSFEWDAEGRPAGADRPSRRLGLEGAVSRRRRARAAPGRRG